MFKIEIKVRVISDISPDSMTGTTRVYIDEKTTDEHIKNMCTKLGEQMTSDLTNDILPAMRNYESTHKESIFELVTKEKEAKQNG